MIFSPTVCHRHTSTLCVAGTGDSVDGCEILGISKENLLHPIQQYVLLLGNSKKGTVQCLVPKHHLAVFFICKMKYFQYI